MIQFNRALRPQTQISAYITLEHANRENIGDDVRTTDIQLHTENAPSFTASVGLAQARPNKSFGVRIQFCNTPCQEVCACTIKNVVQRWHPWCYI